MNISGFTGYTDPILKLIEDDYSPTSLLGNSARVRSAQFNFTSTAITGASSANIALAPIMTPRCRLIAVSITHFSSATSGAFGFMLYNKDGTIRVNFVQSINTVNGQVRAIYGLDLTVEDSGANNIPIFGLRVGALLPVGTQISGTLLYATES